MTPEDEARQQIDAKLMASGWVLQDFRALNLSTARGIALREVPLKSGRCDYLLLVDRGPVGVVEAKKEGATLYGRRSIGPLCRESPRLPRRARARQAALPLRVTGVETFFRDEADPHPRSRPVFAFHRPETLAELLEQPDTLRARLAQMPFAHPLTATGMRDCQVEGITKLEQSFAEAKPRALIQMATGAHTSLASRLARADRAITAPRRAELAQIAGGNTLAELSAALLRAEVQIDRVGILPLSRLQNDGSK